MADAMEGDVGGAILNGALAVTDLTLGGYAAKKAAKGGIYAISALRAKNSRANEWDEVRKTMGDAGSLQPKQPGHHWMIPRNQWGRAVPNGIKNHPWNIKPMPNAEVHGRVHGRYLGKNRYNAAQRYWHGTPTWWKFTNASAAGHPIGAVKGRLDQNDE